jgi:hypothetical protein
MVHQFVRHTPKLRNFEPSILPVSPVVDILSALPPYEWDTITFVLNARYNNNHMPWGAIDLALAGARFRILRRFAFNRARFNRATSAHGFSSRITPDTNLLMQLVNSRGILA